ncbi:hypothetical protein [Sphingomonas sp. RS2018]
MLDDNEKNAAFVTAREMVDRHGRRARQLVVDEIVRAIKDHDIDKAKRWDVVAQKVDRLLAA